MGELERQVQKKIRRTKINKAIINAFVVGGMLAVVTVAPQVLGAMGKLGLINPYQKKQSIRKSFTKLVQQGYVTVEKGYAQLTPKGEKFAAMMGEGKLIPKKPERWDGLWRILVFDIPERRKKTREQLRVTLARLGFYRLQDSVWVYPYDCEDLITLLKIDFHLGKDLLYVIAQRIENDQVLRSQFSL